MFLKITILFFITALTALADEKLPLLEVNGDVFTDVTVTRVTTTDIYFTHSQGIGTAKLKKLTPDLQQHFHYDADKATAAEKEQAQANAEYREKLAKAKPPTPKVPVAEELPTPAANEEDYVAPQIKARSVRGQPAPQFVMEKWFTEAPVTAGKFMLIDFWATWCGPCRASIPSLNAFHAKYNDRLVVVGVSDETEQAVRNMTSPKIDYSVAIDTQNRMGRTLNITAIPHCILIDPKGIVRFEGNPHSLNAKRLEHFLDKYAN